MIKAPIDLQDLRRRIYIKAKAQKSWRFWGLYVHVCKKETLQQAYALAKENDGSPGIDGLTFEAIEAQGLEEFLQQIQDELVNESYRPQRYRIQDIPKTSGPGLRRLRIPCIRDRVVQGALKLILEPIFEADFQPGSYGYRPKRSAHQAIQRVARAIVERKTKIIDLDLKDYFGRIRHDLLFERVTRRINDPKVMGLLKRMLKAGGRRGVPQGGPISPLMSNIFLNAVDEMLERARRVTRNGRYTYVDYARYADDLVVLVDGHPKQRGLLEQVKTRLDEEFAKLQVEVNVTKSRILDLETGGSFGFLGFEFRRVRSLRGQWRAQYTPQLKKRTALLSKLKPLFARFRSQPVKRLIDAINPILKGWLNYFRVGHSARHFSYIYQWVEKKVRRHLARARGRHGFGWNRWSRRFLYDRLGLYGDYQVRYVEEASKALPARSVS